MGEPGALLEVHVLPEESELLDWDKPLSEQGAVADKLMNMEDSPVRQHYVKGATLTDNGSDVYRRLASTLNERKTGDFVYKSPGDELASAALHEAGIPGIKYLDAGSRRADEGTHNYVIFHPSNLRIVGRNGQRLEPVDYDPFAGKAP